MVAKSADHELKLDALEEYQGEYRDLADNWRSLEAKAQGSVAIAGIFIGGAIALVQRMSGDYSSASLIAIAVGTLCFLMSIGFALTALRIRNVSSQPDGASVRKLASDVIASGATDREQRYLAYLEDRLTAWDAGNAAVSECNDQKAASLWAAQQLLAGGLLIFAMVVVAELVRFL